MRIISSFKDYYDCCQAWDQEESRDIWKREPTIYHERTMAGRDMPERDLFLRKPTHRDVKEKGPVNRYGPGRDFMLLDFCGQRYVIPGTIRIPYTTDNYFLNKPRPVKDIEDSVIRVPGIFEHYFGDKWAWFLLDKVNPNSYSKKEYLAAYQRFEKWLAFLKECYEGPSPKGLIDRFPHPILLTQMNRMNLTVLGDIPLREVGFERVMDPFKTWQEIQMFLPNIGKPDEAPLTVGDDRTIAFAKGFDDQSFRTIAPGKKKLNRRENRMRKKGIKQEGGSK